MVGLVRFPEIPFASILKNITISFHSFDIEKCDERTFYITITITKGSSQTTCDLIFLVDQQLYGAFSLNEKYDHARQFFKQHFQYDLMYSDEQAIAKLFSQSTIFRQAIKKYTTRYPSRKNKLF